MGSIVAKEIGIALQKVGQFFREIKGDPASKVTLVCFPYAAGFPTFCNPLAKLMPPSVSVISLDLDLLEAAYTGERALEGWAQSAADDFINIIAGDCAVFGHSFGGIFGYEFIRALEARNRDVLHFIVSACGSPQSPRLDEPMALRTDKELINHIVALGACPPEVAENNFLMDAILPRFRRDFSLIEDYPVGEVGNVSCCITALGGNEDPTCSRKSLRGWRGYTQNRFFLKTFPGNHFYILNRDRQVAKIIRMQLRDAYIEAEMKRRCGTSRSAEPALELAANGARRQ